MALFIFFIITSALGFAIGAVVGIQMDNVISPDCWYGLGVGVLVGIAPITGGDSLDFLGDLF